MPNLTVTFYWNIKSRLLTLTVLMLNEKVKVKHSMVALKMNGKCTLTSYPCRGCEEKPL